MKELLQNMILSILKVFGVSDSANNTVDNSSIKKESTQKSARIIRSSKSSPTNSASTKKQSSTKVKYTATKSSGISPKAKVDNTLLKNPSLVDTAVQDVKYRVDITTLSGDRREITSILYNNSDLFNHAVNELRLLKLKKLGIL